MPGGGRWEGYEHEPEHGRERHAAVPFGLAEVIGPSMVPTLRPGDRLIVQYGGTVRLGDVVVLRHPMQQDLLIVKRAVERREGGWWVLGDNPFAENDSREFGTVPDELVLARAWVRLRPSRGFRGSDGQRSLSAALSWAVSAVRPVGSERSLSRRLRAR
jgi:nickel-type superoxide dismutase maturation protease